MRLRFWFRNGLQTVAAILGASGLYGLLMGMQLDSSGLADVLGLMPIYLTLFGAIMLLAMMLAVYKFSLGLSISLGSTRWEAFVGLQVFRLLPTLVTVGLTALLTLMPGVEAFWGPAVVIPAALGLFLATGAFGSLLGMVYLRFGKLGAVLSVILFILIGITGGVLTVMAIQANRFSLSISAAWIPWTILAAGAVIYGLMMLLESNVVRKYQVRM